MWSLRTIGLRQHIDLPGEVTAHLVLRGGLVSGEVTNNTRLALHDCAIVGAAGSSAVIPLLAPGQTVRIAPFSLGGAAVTAANYASGSTSTLLANI
jgi:hypothetical protein